MSDTKSDPLATQIADDVIAEALKSVEKHTVKPEAAPEPPPADPDQAAAEFQKMRQELGEARAALRQREAELEMSQSLGRETLEKLKDQHERMLRAAADLDNYKKRAARERDEAARFGMEKLLKDFLPVLDNLDRALDHAKSAADFEGLLSGIKMTRKLFEDSLARHGVKGFSAMGQPFDPHLHEAMQSVESDAAPGTVVQELVRGFQLHDRLIRPAMVAVARPRPGAPAEAPPAAGPPAPEPQLEPKAGGEGPTEPQGGAAQ